MNRLAVAAMLLGMFLFGMAPFAHAEVGDMGASGSPITEDEVEMAACTYVSRQ
ncbi:MAG TPA: hypothetical protein VLZ05_08120 [Mycobacterium sp.]|nr:hypothetical protein [Mycobacterium sp.]HUH68846.1 hypothetical protein [Mycobacterium sp.]